VNQAINDQRDIAIATATPILPAPRFGKLEPVPIGQYRYVMAANGIFVQARTPVLDISLRFQDVAMRVPYGQMKEEVRFTRGVIPESLKEQIYEASCRVAPNEWAGLICFNFKSGQYELIEPEADTRSPVRVQYKRDSFNEKGVIVDLHSHGTSPLGQRGFSATDDRDDEYGIYLACVLGKCTSPQDIEIRTRIVIHGMFYQVDWTPW